MRAQRSSDHSRHFEKAASSAASGALRNRSSRKAGRHVVSIDGPIEDLRSARRRSYERANLFDVGEDVAELSREELQLLAGKLEARQIRDTLHILSSEA